MGNLTVEQVEADVDYLMGSLGSNKRLIPSPSVLLRTTSSIPLLSVVLSFISTLVFYFSADWTEKTTAGLLYFLATEGWVVILATTIIGLFFMLLTYNKVLMYFTLPEDVRNKSTILQHLKGCQQNGQSLCISNDVFCGPCSHITLVYFCYSCTSIIHDVCRRYHN